MAGLPPPAHTLALAVACTLKLSKPQPCLEQRASGEMAKGSEEWAARETGPPDPWVQPGCLLLAPSTLSSAGESPSRTRNIGSDIRGKAGAGVQD